VPHTDVSHAPADVLFARGQCWSKFARWLLAATLLVALQLLASLAHAQGVSIDQATPAQHKAAKKKLAEGQKLFKAGKLEQAIQAFEAAWAIVHEPEARLMLARSHQNQGELLKAHAAYSEAVTEAEAAAREDTSHRETQRLAQKELSDLEGVLAKLTIQLRHAPPGTSVTIDGEAVPASKLGEAILMQPGQVSVVATTSDGREASRTLTLTAGQNAKVDLAFTRDSEASLDVGTEPSDTSEPAPATSASSPTNFKKVGAWVAGGVGVLGVAAFGVFGSMSNAKYEDLQDSCPNDRCGADQQDDIDAGKRYQTIANVGLAVGIVGIGASTALFVLGSPSATESPSAARVELGVGLGTIHVRGRFQ
jgi:hypothetical protein